jgi:hypothetical protein
MFNIINPVTLRLIMKVVKAPILLAATVALLCAGAADEYQSAKRKALLIETDKVPPQGSIAFTPGEVNAYAAEEARKEVPEGLRNPVITLGSGTARGTALIDFAKVQTARGNPPGMLLGWLLRGEREVTVDVAIQSDNGTARVDVQSVTVGNATLSGRALDMVIEYYVMSRFPEAVIGKPFALRHNIKRVTVSPSGATFLFGQTAAQ